jgi:hypothetical protein
MLSSNTHTGLRQIGHDTLSHTFPAEIIENTLSRYATIGAEHESAAFRLGGISFGYISHHYSDA